MQILRPSVRLDMKSTPILILSSHLRSGLPEMVLIEKLSNWNDSMNFLFLLASLGFPFIYTYILFF